MPHLSDSLLDSCALELAQLENSLAAKGFRLGFSFFGSARLRENDGRPLSRHIPATRELARRVATKGRELIGPGFALLSGGGPGIMQAVNEGATDAGALSIGLNIVLPNEQIPNPAITPGMAFSFSTFVARKHAFFQLSHALVCFPGGLGTFDEVYEALTLRQTRKLPHKRVPIVLMDRSFWNATLPLQLLVDEGLVEPRVFDDLLITDSLDEAEAFLTDFLATLA